MATTGGSGRDVWFGCCSGRTAAIVGVVALMNVVAFQAGFMSTALHPSSDHSNAFQGLQNILATLPTLNRAGAEHPVAGGAPLRGAGREGQGGPVASPEPSPPARQLESLAPLVEVPQTIDELSDEFGNAKPGVSYDDWVASGARKMASDAGLVRTMPQGIPPVGSPEYALQCAQFHGGSATTVQPFSDSGRNAWGPSAFSKHAIVTMAAGDAAARMAIAMAQSLRDVGTCPGIDIVVMLSGGGAGSDDCRHKRIPGQKDRTCVLAHPPSKQYVVSQVYLDALHALGVHTMLIEPVPSATAVIPGGRQAFWGLAFNKLRVFGLHQYATVLWLDSDVFVVRNLDHLLFYPEFTAAFTMDCCNMNASPRPSGGFWVIQPSLARLKFVLALVNGPDPLVPLNLEHGNNHWHFGDMSVVMALYVKLRKVPKYYHLFESYDARVDEARIRKWYTPTAEDYPIRWGGYGPDMVLGGNNDSTVYASKSEYSDEGQFVVSNKDGNLADRLAFDLELPSLAGRRWHMLNESYDWLAVECQCAPGRDMGPEWIFSVHFSCLPGHIKKPGHFKSLPEQKAFLAAPPGDMKPCLVEWYQRWTAAFERGMGELVGKVWNGD